MNEKILQAIAREADEAERQYGPFTSAHEALGVLLEEFHELTDAIKGHSLAAVQKEALQVATVAARLVEQCQTRTNSFRGRSKLWEP